MVYTPKKKKLVRQVGTTNEHHLYKDNDKEFNKKNDLHVPTADCCMDSFLYSK